MIQPLRGLRLASFGVVIVLLAVLAPTGPVQAHTPLLGNPSHTNGGFYLQPGTVVTLLVFSGMSPSDVNWEITLQIGIFGPIGPPCVLKSSFQWGLFGTSPILQYGEWTEVSNEWNYGCNSQVSQFDYRNTLTAHAGSNVDLWLTIRNFDSTLADTFIYQADSFYF